MRKSFIIYMLPAFLLVCSAQAQQLQTPQLISPADGETIHGAFGEIQEVTLTWESDPNALSYVVSANTVVGSITDTIAVNTTQYVNRRQSPGEWQWQVKAIGAEGIESPWSELWSYTYTPQTPTPTPEGFPELDVSDDEVFDYRDLFVFQKSWGTKTEDPGYDFTADLVTDGKINEKDLLLMAKAWKYRGSVNIAAPSLVAPASGAVITFLQAQTPGLAWNTLSEDDGSMMYNISIEHRQGLWPKVDALVSDTNFSFQSTITGIYDWRVRGRDPQTLLFGPWSEKRNFDLQGQTTSE